MNTRQKTKLDLQYVLELLHDRLELSLVQEIVQVRGRYIKSSARVLSIKMLFFSLMILMLKRSERISEVKTASYKNKRLR